MPTTTSKWLSMVVAVLAGGTAVAAETPYVMPPLELQQPNLAPPPDTGLSLMAGLADLGMRTAESGAEAGLALVAFGDAWGNPSSSLPYVLVGADALLILGAPAVEALVCSWIGDNQHRHPYGPLVVTSYASHALVDGVTYALLGTSYAGVVYIVGSAIGSAAMGAVHGATAVPLTSQSVMPSPTFERVPPVAAPQGAAFRF
jgi:hypothetical protein